ncbi:MAG: UDP-N-acetylmuramoyl-L-alanine--D-glutamate ligase, partial [Neisseriaceae bacterium]|nr:UDP-N-acetylmuramoyl-L-alanine--D-glutamate ligase [Neisseriaceae bacterium]
MDKKQMDNQFRNKKILVAGLGKSGMATLRFLNECGAAISGYDKVLSDERRSALAQEFPHASFYSDELKMALNHSDFDAIVLSPGISAFLPE